MGFLEPLFLDISYRDIFVYVFIFMSIIGYIQLSAASIK